MGWIAYGVAWVAAALFWTLASAAGARRPALETLPYGLLTMGVAAVMGLAVWRLTGRVAWDWRAARFYVVHGAALGAYSAVYSTSWIWPDVLTGRSRLALAALGSSPVLGWNLLLGSLLYAIVVGLSYAVRAQRRARAQEAAAADARLLAQQAQLAALRAQINPHFLFNALHTVGALVTADPARADRALERLGDLLRFALEAGDEVLFSEEWKFTHDYLAFERLRLGDRLRVGADAQPATLAMLVPPLILQPLVENAVRHGIAPRPEGGHLDILARAEGGCLVLRVSDDGGGAARDAHEGRGLGSVRRRLAALYGEAATVTVAPGANGFAVTLRLPLRPADETRVPE
jgi:hypothetical protein